MKRRLFAACSLLVICAPGILSGAVFNVDRIDDDAAAVGCDDATPNDCSLRGAVIAANGNPDNDEIVLQAETYTLSIPRGSETASGTDATKGDLDILENVTVTGAGPGNTVIDGNGGVVQDRVFQIPNSASDRHVALSGLTVQGGRTTSSPGAGISNAGLLTLFNLLVTGNVTNGGDGAGIYSYGTLTIVGSGISGNTAAGPTGSGAGLYSDGPLIVADSTVSGNTTQGDFAEAGGLFILFSGLTQITGSTFSGNTTQDNGGGVHLHNPGTLFVTDTTFSGNSADDGGGALSVSTGGIVFLNHVTMTGNTAAADGNDSPSSGGGGIYTEGTVNIANTIMAGNQDASTGAGADIDPDCLSLGGAVLSQGHNVIQVPDGCAPTGDTNSDIVGKEPLLSSLGDFGGATMVHALLAGSPAIDAADSVECAFAESDQRGAARPQGPACDIGAYEKGACGDGLPEPEEECDDGNTDDGDGCDSNCQTETGGTGGTAGGTTGGTTTGGTATGGTTGGDDGNGGCSLVLRSTTENRRPFEWTYFELAVVQR